MSIFSKLSTWLSDDDSQSPSPILDEEKKAATALMVEMALHDGDFGREEKDHILHLLQDEFGLPADEAEKIFSDSVAEVETSNQILSHTRKIKDHYDEAGRERIMEMLWQVVYADGVEDDYESNLMRRLAGLLYVSDRRSGEIRNKVRANLS